MGTALGMGYGMVLHFGVRRDNWQGMGAKTGIFSCWFDGWVGPSGKRVVVGGGRTGCWFVTCVHIIVSQRACVLFLLGSFCVDVWMDGWTGFCTYPLEDHGNGGIVGNKWMGPLWIREYMEWNGNPFFLLLRAS